VDDPRELIAAHTYGTWRAQREWKTPLYVSRGEGVYFFDEADTRYLDFSSQLMCLNLGYENKPIVDAICKQAKKLPYVAPGFACQIKAEAIESLLRAMPPGLDRFFFSTSGTEANEAALKLIRQYMAPKYKIISRYRSYHGSTSGSIALTGDHRRWFAEPMNKVPGVVFAPDAYCYRCPFALEYPACNIQCVEYIDYIIKEEGNVAAIFVEPIVGTNGVIVPPKEYFPRLRDIADENQVLLVLDEVMSGWYRTGQWFAINHWEVKPDILTTAKGCTGAYTPLGITATTSAIREYFEDRFLSHGHTYAMHPLAMAALPVAIEEYEKLLATGLVKRVAEHLKMRLSELMTHHECIGDVRGIGHFWAVEIVKNRDTKERFDTKVDQAALKSVVAAKVSNEALRHGLYVVSWYNNLIIAPPLTISERQVDEGVEVLGKILESVDKFVE